MSSGEEYRLGDDSKPKEGLRISFCSGFLFAFLAIAIAVGVGLIVHFVEKTPEVTCNCSGPDIQSTESHQNGLMSLQQCKDKAKDPSTEICKACPGIQTTAEETKLPKTVQPLHYNIEMKPNMYNDDPESFTFSGKVKVTILCLKAASDVIMNSLDLDVTSVAISTNSTESGEPGYKSHEINKATQRLIIHLDGDLKVDQFYSIEMVFSGPLRDDMDGFYLSTYHRQGKPVYLATTQFESKSARKAFPCFDEPELKATFDVTLIRKKDLISISNMEIKHTETREQGFEADIYQTSPIMSTYLVALIVSDFEKVTGTTKRGLKFSVWSQKESTPLLHYALKVGETTIYNFEDYFNISFPLPKQDMVAIPDFAMGAMENWGCITYRAENLFYQEGVTSGRIQRHILIDITHELAHQWFGDLVTMQWWDDTWLNEGFATFFAYIGSDLMEPQWEMLSQMVTEELFPVFQSDALVSSHPIYTEQKVALPFDSISYNKAGCILKMLRFFIGEETFRQGIIRYLRPLEYGNANHNDLWKALHEQSKADAKNVDVVSVMRTWMEQMNYPVVTVRRSGTNQIHIHQGRFTLDDPRDDPGTYTSPFNYTWSIPFTVTTSEEKNFNVSDRDIIWVLHDTKTDIYNTPQTIPDDVNSWIIGNIQHHGFYRVNYDVTNWRNIIKQLKNDHRVIDPVNRAQILSDAIDLGRAGLLDTRIGLETLEYLSKERNYFPWNAASSKLKFLDRMLRNTEIFGAFEDFVESISEQPFKFYTLADQGANHIESQVRREVASTACRYSNQDCLNDARQRFKSWQKNRNGHSISPELLETVLCTGIMHGETDDWYMVYDAYTSETSLSLKDDMIIALGCSQETWLMELFLQKATTPSITRKNDAAKVISAALQNNPKLRSIAWNFLRENYVRLRDVLSTNTHYLTEMIHSIADAFNTEFQLRELESFINSTADVGAGSRGFSQVLAGTRANIKWMKTNYQVVKQWLQDLGFYDRTQGSKTLPSSEDVFLPKTVKPIHYDLEMKPNMYEGDPSNFTYEGQVQILIQCLKSTNEIVLHSKTHTITSGSVHVEAEAKGGNLHYTSHKRDEKRDLLKIRVSKPLEVGEQYTISIGFTSPLRDDLAGFYLSSYKHENQTRYLATTHMESESARKAFPCFDEPELKATFSITLVRRADFVSTSNMPSRTEKRPNGYKADIFQTSKKMSTYLVAFVVCDFKFINGTTSEGLPFRVWARADVLDQLDYALDVGTKVISHYEKYFNLSFPLPKQDMVAIPDFAMGAMENWGMITYREQDLLFKDGVTNNEAKQKVTVAIAHELAHMWFGDLVTPKWWDDLWLNEGFATFVEYMGTDIANPGFKMDEQFYVEEMMAVFTEDGLATSHPIYVDVKTMDEINEIFDDISYNKGGSVLRMLKFFLGEDTFKKGLYRYLRENQYSNADRNDLWSALDKQVEVEGKSVEVGTTMRTWTLQMNYPVVSVRVENSSTLVLKQQRFLFDPDTANLASYDSPYNYQWNIPFTFTTNKQSKFTQTDADIVWIRRTDDSDIYHTVTELPDTADTKSWIVGNIGLYGLYRVQYEEANWRALIKQLNNDHTKIDQLNRAQIIYDAWDFAKSGMLSQNIAVQTVEYLDKETDYIPWRAAVEKLDVVGDMLQNTEVFGRFQAFLKAKSTTPFEAVGFNDTGSTQLESFARRVITDVACKAGNVDCTSEARGIFEDWKTKNKPMYPELRKVILCTALREGSPEDWFYVFNRYKTEKEIAVKDDILLTLGCTGEEWLLHTLMKKSINPSEVSRADALRLLFETTKNARAQPIVWNFVKDNWAEIRDGDNYYYLGKVIIGATRAFNIPSHLMEIENFVAATPNLGVGERAFKQAIEQTRSNIAWMDNIYPSVKKWLGSLTLI